MVSRIDAVLLAGRLHAWTADMVDGSEANIDTRSGPKQLDNGGMVHWSSCISRLLIPLFQTSLHRMSSPITCSKATSLRGQSLLVA